MLQQLLLQLILFLPIIDHSNSNPVQPIARIPLEEPESVEDAELYVDVGSIAWHRWW